MMDANGLLEWLVLNFPDTDTIALEKVITYLYTNAYDPIYEHKISYSDDHDCHEYSSTAPWHSPGDAADLLIDLRPISPVSVDCELRICHGAHATSCSYLRIVASSLETRVSGPDRAVPRADRKGSSR